jgi:hypothetical protein
MTTLEDQLRAINAIDADPGVATFRAMAKRRRPDLSNRADTDVLEWCQRTAENANDFFEAYARHPSSRGYNAHAEEMCDLMKRLIIVFQDAQGLHEELD